MTSVVRRKYESDSVLAVNTYSLYTYAREPSSQRLFIAYASDQHIANLVV